MISKEQSTHMFLETTSLLLLYIRVSYLKYIFLHLVSCIFHIESNMTEGNVAWMFPRNIFTCVYYKYIAASYTYIYIARVRKGQEQAWHRKESMKKIFCLYAYTCNKNIE